MATLTVHQSELALDVAAPVFPATFAARAAGIASAALGMAVIVIGARARPLLSAAWVVVPLTAVAVLAPALAATAAPSDMDALMTIGTALPRFTLGPGAWLLVAAAVLSPVAGLLCLLAGNADRDADAGVLPDENGRLPDEDGRAAPSTVRAVAAVAGVVAVLGLLSPAYTSPFGDAPWIGRDALPGLETWMQLMAAVAIVVAAGLVPRSRPSRAVGLAVGAALVCGGYALLARGPMGARAGVGSYLSVAGMALFLLVGGVLVAIQRRRTE